MRPEKQQIALYGFKRVMSDGTHVDGKSFAAFGTIMSLLAIGALIGNIICFKMTHRLLRSKPSLALVLNLNMSDIVVALVSWVGFMFQQTASYIQLEVHVLVHKLFWSILLALGNVTLLTLTGLAGDCFMALRWPLHYRDMATNRSINIYITVIWILSILAGGGDFLAAVSAVGSKDQSFTEAVHKSMVLTRTDLTIADRLTASVAMLVSNALSLLCLLTMVTMYGYILRKIRQIHSDRRLSKQGGFKSEIHAVRTTLMIFTSFLLLWLPTFVVNIVSVAKPDFLSKLSALEASFIGHSADSLLMVHSMVDAIIYGVRVNKTIRRHRKNREGQAGFSRANTLRRTSSSDKVPPVHQEEMASDTSDRKLSSNSSIKCGTINCLEETLEPVLSTDTPPSDDSGINSPHKMSPKSDGTSSDNRDTNKGDVSPTGTLTTSTLLELMPRSHVPTMINHGFISSSDPGVNNQTLTKVESDDDDTQIFFINHSPEFGFTHVTIEHSDTESVGHSQFQSCETSNTCSLDKSCQSTFESCDAAHTSHDNHNNEEDSNNAHFLSVSMEAMPLRSSLKKSKPRELQSLASHRGVTFSKETKPSSNSKTTNHKERYHISVLNPQISSSNIKDKMNSGMLDNTDSGMSSRIGNAGGIDNEGFQDIESLTTDIEESYDRTLSEPPYCQAGVVSEPQYCQAGVALELRYYQAGVVSDPHYCQAGVVPHVTCTKL